MSIEVQILLRNSLEHIQAKEYGAAKELLQKAQTLDQKNPNILRFLSIVAALQYDYRKALELINQSIALLTTLKATSAETSWALAKEL